MKSKNDKKIGNKFCRCTHHGGLSEPGQPRGFLPHATMPLPILQCNQLLESLFHVFKNVAILGAGSGFNEYFPKH